MPLAKVWQRRCADFTWLIFDNLAASNWQLAKTNPIPSTAKEHEGTQRTPNPYAKRGPIAETYANLE
jgi:hypothetical protein